MDRIDRFSTSTLSVLLGLFTILVLIFIAFELLPTLEVFPKVSYELQLVYISLSIVLGSYITSCIASKFIHNAHIGHSIVLGIIVFIVMFFINILNSTLPSYLPYWYLDGLIMIALPSAFLGGVLHLIKIKTLNTYNKFKLMLLFLLSISPMYFVFDHFVDQYYKKLSTSKNMLCMSGERGQGSTQQQVCLEQHIPGYGGYYNIGSCKEVIYLTNLKHEKKARSILLPILEYLNPLCKDKLSLDIRKGQYTFSELSDLRFNAKYLSLFNEDTKIPNVLGPSGAPYLNNRISWNVEKNDLIPQIKQILLEHNITLEAFHFISLESKVK